MEEQLSYLEKFADIQSIANIFNIQKKIFIFGKFSENNI